MKLKNRKGSTLALTLMVFAVLMIFATFILSFMVTENKQAMHHQNKTQAYYIARSGLVAVERAIYRELNSSELEMLNTKLDNNPLELEQGDLGDSKDGNYRITIKKVGDDPKDLEITSVGIVNDVESTVIKVMKHHKINIKNPIFINGDLEENDVKDKNIKLFDSNGITEGTMGVNGSIPLGFKPEGFKIEQNPDVFYDDFYFPEIPIIDELTDSKPSTISNSIKIALIEGNITVNANDKDVDIVVDSLNVNDITIIGDYNVRIFVNSSLTIDKLGSFNTIDKSNQLNIFYLGNTDIKIPKATTFYGNIYIKQADLNIMKELVLVGNLITNYTSLSLNKGDTITDKLSIHGLVYAPNAEVFMKKSMEVKGAIIAKTISLNKDSTFTFSEDVVPTDILISYRYNPGYYK